MPPPPSPFTVYQEDQWRRQGVIDDCPCPAADRLAFVIGAQKAVFDAHPISDVQQGTHYPKGKIAGAVRSRICSTSASGRPTSRIQEKVRAYVSNDNRTGKSLPGKMCSAPNAF